MSNSLKLICDEVKRDFQPVMKLLQSEKIYRGEDNVFDPIIGNFAKYAIPSADVMFYEELNRETRKILFKMISEALEIKIQKICDLDFEMDPREPRLVVMYLLLEDGTEISVPLMDRSATIEE